MNDSYLLRLNNSKSPGPDGIVPKLIKIVASVIVKPLTHIYNMSILGLYLMHLNYLDLFQCMKIVTGHS